MLAILSAAYGWRPCFLVTGSIGLVFAVLWFVTYQHPEQHPHVNRAELDYIRSDGVEEESGPVIRWRKALMLPETWGFLVARFLTTPVWMMYLWWLPLFLNDVYKVTPKERAWAVMGVYVTADIGSVLGGWVSGHFMRRGWAHGRARKAAMAMCAFCMPVGAMAVLAPNAALAVALVSLAAGAHQGWSANLYTTISDIFPRRAVASVVSIGGAAGSLGSFFFASTITGYVVAHWGYRPVFLSMGCFHPIALALVHWLMRDMHKVTLQTV
jgi:ACS family hexuronate transporter-like MFS transporter